MRLPHTSLLIAFASVLSSAGCKQEPTAAPVKSVTFEQYMPIPITLTLMRTQDGGRTGPIADNYRPQVRFTQQGIEALCAVTLGNSAVALEPGHTSDATLSCDTEVHVDSTSNTFTMLEGGKPIGMGTLQIP
jgi:translation elongation factor EF-Tu-like GTPase